MMYIRFAHVREEVNMRQARGKAPPTRSKFFKNFMMTNAGTTGGIATG
ncbi:MAG: hypothetical protein Q8P21_02165 [bacterium]|nr:hypothetical protein [bacterium]